jgi:putative salt-induced outer membrane protein
MGMVPMAADNKETTMIRMSLLALLVAAAPAAAEPWKGTAELGLAVSRGNAESENLNAKLDFTREHEQWLYAVSASALRSKGDVVVIGANGTTSTASVTTANRYEVGGKIGYKVSDRMYVFGSARYDNDDFASYQWQLIASAGVGYQFVKTDTTEFSVEAGPGARRVQPIEVLVTTPPPPRLIEPDAETDLVGRLGANFRHQLTESTELTNVTLVETGGGNTFIQNDTGVSVKLSDRFALKTGLQFRHNSDVPPGVDKTDTLLTTNIVIGF